MTLINGDRLLAGAVPGGGISHELIAGTARGVNAALVSMRLGARIYVIPADAVPYLGRGLNADLFDVGRLLRDQVHGGPPGGGSLRGARAIPARSDDYLRSRRDRPRLPDLRVGEDVRRRACPPVTADHARGSYGQDGLFAGRVSISLTRAASPRPAAQRAAGRHFPMGTLTVTGTNLAGKPDTGEIFRCRFQTPTTPAGSLTRSSR